MKKSNIVFLDRDGTIIVDKGYMYKPEHLEFPDNALAALRLIQNNYRLVIVSNQSGISRGMFHVSDYEQFNDALLRTLNDNGINVEATLYCPHSPEDDCECRKPKTMMVFDWLKSKNLELNKASSYVIGDKISDMDFARNLGIEGILISKSKSSNANGCYVVGSLHEAAEKILC